jgi:CTP synthase (UTP-ammonia lyase)
MSDLKIGILGDYDQHKTSHPAINSSLQHAAAKLDVKIQIDWLPTPDLLQEKTLERLAAFDGLWSSSGSPFKSTQGMLNGIRRAREMGKPFIAT